LATLLGNLRHVPGQGKPCRTDEKKVVVNMALDVTTWNWTFGMVVFKDKEPWKIENYHGLDSRGEI
jgi:hypothetical protein